VRAGALVGLSAGFELWGMLGAVVFVLAPRARAAAAGLVTQSSVAFALFLPFVLAGEFRMFDYRWQVNGDTLLGLFVEPGTPFYAVWLAPLAVVVVRLSLDPVRYPWYWVAPEALALLGAAELLGGDALRSLRARRLEPRPRS